MDNSFSNIVAIPVELVEKIMNLLGPEDIPKLPYVSKDFYMTCKRSFFIDEHSSRSRLNYMKQMLFCVPVHQQVALPFFWQVDPFLVDEQIPQIFSRLPTFFAHDVVSLIGVDEGVLCFCNNVDQANQCFYLWNPVTHQSVKVVFPYSCVSGVFIRCGFGFDRNNGEFIIVAMRHSSPEETTTFVSIFRSYSRTWSDVPPLEYGSSLLFDKSMHIKGFIYWLSSNKDISHGDSHIVIAYDITASSWSFLKVSFTVCASEWEFINLRGKLGIATWRNVSDMEKSYVIWLCMDNLDVGLPDDIMIEIFVRLNASELINLKLVCRQWLSTLKSPFFIRLHFRYWKDKDYGYFITSKIGSIPTMRNSVIHLPSNQDGVESLCELSLHPILNQVTDLRVIGIHHGKFIYSFGYVDDPSTRFDILNYISPKASIPVQYGDFLGMVCAYSLVHGDFTYSTWSLDELKSRDVKWVLHMHDLHNGLDQRYVGFVDNQLVLQFFFGFAS
ncbi:F-box/kelch-repeat protein [Senna tora]|uniref:F-box/kelch-repeat protein n=1 Tax=Senna tora TaxID=362788 RepID=A0A834SZX3_9FABA|nr:F-box/kelch-repeat protein [Senna tora]